MSNSWKWVPRKGDWVRFSMPGGSVYSGVITEIDPSVKSSKISIRAVEKDGLIGKEVHLQDKDLDLIGRAPIENPRPLKLGDRVKLHPNFNVPPYFHNEDGVVVEISNYSSDLPGLLDPAAQLRLIAVKLDKFASSHCRVFESDLELLQEKP